MSEARRRFLRSLAPSKPESKPGLAASTSSQPVTGGTSAAASSKDLSVPVSSSSSSSKQDGGDTTRQRYIKMLGHDAEIPARREDPETDLPPSKTAPGVRFTLEGLVAFCDTAEGIVRGKSAQESRPQARKRPNYNSTKRRFHAKVSDRAPFLGLAGRSFLRFCLQRVSTPRLAQPVSLHEAKVWPAMVMISRDWLVWLVGSAGVREKHAIRNWIMWRPFWCNSCSSFGAWRNTSKMSFWGQLSVWRASQRRNGSCLASAWGQSVS